ncbi:L-seryl-tRNA(Sec) selenium transferase [Anaerohalosphaera lusitana]|uniref:L-seryl-tRNA(Sec) selenium transferase n=1 Tax=Anaerohalosphaera lusitana TaxID=1936003 RepID=A0A1U9NK82_9BACT|nr:L-seryl-tRNA(Sec) selenium transferase [Anaerohalosphaera lusitana]AQT68217.1 L-seryl-tRNA(Sec) selenium transferase [Anaerohalosphaera lusitana]
MSNTDKQTLLRNIPSVSAVLEQLKHQIDTQPTLLHSDITRACLDDLRSRILAGNGFEPPADLPQYVLDQVTDRITQLNGIYHARVVNAAGIVLHTGLGRAVVPKPALDHLTSDLAGYSLLQLSTDTGKRSRRDARIEQLLQTLTGAPAATVVNNNAAATSIVLNTIAKDKEVIVSRGQLVEIGGSFRLPDVMAFSGAKLVEVGTTNKTHPRDYLSAITENTAAILRVHPSNYKVQGFSSEVPLDELVDIAHCNDLLMFDDVGAGSLLDFTRYGFDHEPTLVESVNAGADVITSSGDKLIGASQAGIILGKPDIITAIRKNQFARILRVDKMTLTVLEQTLKLFLDQENALKTVPTLRMMLRKPDSIRRQANRIKRKLAAACPNAQLAITKGHSQPGSGSLPAQSMPTSLVTVTAPNYSADQLARKLRKYKTPVFVRIQNEQVLIDPRTLLDGDEKTLIQALTWALSTKE